MMAAMVVRARVRRLTSDWIKPAGLSDGYTQAEDGNHPEDLRPRHVGRRATMITKNQDRLRRP
jgi:hypothetical protein